MFSVYNEHALAQITRKEVAVKLSAFDTQATECIECGACENICPQNINIREYLKKLAKMSAKNA